MLHSDDGKKRTDLHKIAMLQDFLSNVHYCASFNFFVFKIMNRKIIKCKSCIYSSC